VTEAGASRSAGAGGSAGGCEAGLTGTAAAGGGEEAGVCFGRRTLAAGVGCTATGVTGTIGVATAEGGGVGARRKALRPARGMLGA
jgi:hypothetical protein